MAGVVRLITAFVIAGGFIAAWLAFTWIVMLVTLYIVRAIPLSGWRRPSSRPGPNEDDRRP
jgi:hypothetical protein